MNYLKCTGLADGQPCFNGPLDGFIADMRPGDVLKRLSADEYITDRQRAWWKGVLLPSLAKDTGDSREYWETRLKLAVMPDEFTPVFVPYLKQVFPVVPSITKLGKRKMMELIDGSIAHLRDGYDGQFQWVTGPDPSLRK